MVATDPSDLRTRIIRLFTFAGGIYFFLYFVLPESVLTDYGVKERHEQISNGFIAIGAMAIGLGLFNLIRGHGATVVFRRAGWSNSLALLVGLFLTIAVTSAQWISSMRLSQEVRGAQILGEFATKLAEGDQWPMSEKVAALGRYGSEWVARIQTELDEAASRGESHAVLRGEVATRLSVVREKLESLKGFDWSVPSEGQRNALLECSREASALASSYGIYRRLQSRGDLIQSLYNFLYDGIFNQLGSAMFALLGVYIAAAAYRAFRVQTLESALMMLAAVVVMLGQISFGRVIYEGIAELRQWLLEVPNSAAFRAIRLGAGVAGLMLAIRMWLSIESKSFSSEKKS